jgi:hypothetical protein
VVDISDAANPRLVGTYSSPDNSVIARRIVVSGSYAYMLNKHFDESGNPSTNAFTVIDISNPASPRRTGGYAIGPAYGLAVSGSYAYIAAGLSGLQVFDISNPASPKPVGSFATHLDEGSDVAVVGGYAYLATSQDLHVIDFSDHARPLRIGGSSNSLVNIRGVTANRDYVFVADWNAGLIILNKYTDLRIGPAIVADDGRLRLRLSGANGQRVRVQRSINLRDWEDWKTVTLGDTGCDLTESIVSNSQCFYRAVEDNSVQETTKPRRVTQDGVIGAGVVCRKPAGRYGHEADAGMQPT